MKIIFTVLTVFFTVELANAEILKVSVIIDTGGEEKIVSEIDTFDLELGEKIKALTVSGSTDDLIIEQQFETSLTLMNEGPHLDFTDWKHGYTKWTSLELKDAKYVVLAEPEEKDMPFPKTTKKERQDYLKIFMKEKFPSGDYENWEKLINQCIDERNYPCGVGVSKILFQLKSKSSGNVIKTIKAVVPMGC